MFYRETKYFHLVETWLYANNPPIPYTETSCHSFTSIQLPINPGASLVGFFFVFFLTHFNNVSTIDLICQQKVISVIEDVSEFRSRVSFGNVT